MSRRRRETIVKFCREYVEQLQGRGPFKLSSSDLCTLIVKSLSNDEAKDRVLSFRDDLAVSSMEEILKILECRTPLPSPDKMNNETKSKLRRLLVQLSKNSAKMPASLFLSGIADAEKYAVAGGGYADIFRASLQGSPVALKRLRIFQSSMALENSYTDMCREALLWQQLNHPFILPFLGMDCEIFNPYFCMVTPWMQFGNINHFIEKELRDNSTKRLPFERWLAEIAEGLQYLHLEHIVHGDLRGANILIGSDRCIRLADFGMSRFADSTSASFGSSSAGAVRWAAPEVIRGERLSYENDVYAFGCIWIEIFTRRRPFYDVPHDFQVVSRKLDGAQPAWPSASNNPRIRVSPSDWEFIKSCWNEPSARPTVTQLVEMCQDRFYMALTQPRPETHMNSGKKVDPARKHVHDASDRLSFRSSPGSSFQVNMLANSSHPSTDSNNSSPFSMVSAALSSPPSHFSPPGGGFVLVNESHPNSLSSLQFPFH